MNPYTRYVLPWAIDITCGVEPFKVLRRQLIPRATGRVLEIGVGTGHNLPYYDRSRVAELIVLDPAEQMHARARRRAADAGIDVRVLGLPAERIPLGDDEIDTVVMTFTLCSVADPDAVVGELARVLRPEGELIFAEHGRAPDEGVRRWQRRLDPIQRRVAGGCHSAVTSPRSSAPASRSEPLRSGTSRAPRSRRISTPAPRRRRPGPRRPSSG